MQDLLGLFLVLIIAYLVFVRKPEGYTDTEKSKDKTISECSRQSINTSTLDYIFGYKKFVR